MRNREQINKDIDDLFLLVALQKAQGSFPAGLGVPVTYAAGTVLSMGPARVNNAWFIGGAQSTVNLPNPAGGSVVGGDLVILKFIGNVANPLLINATGGALVELLNNEGFFSGANGQTSFSGNTGQGGCIAFQYDNDTNVAPQSRWGLLFSL